MTNGIFGAKADKRKVTVLTKCMPTIFTLSIRILTPYHACSTRSSLLNVLISKPCWPSCKQCCPWSDARLSGHTLFAQTCLPEYSRTSMARTSLGPMKFVRDMGSSSHWGLIMAPVQEANSDNLGEIFSIFYTTIVCWVYSLESPRWGDSNEYTQHTML